MSDAKYHLKLKRCYTTALSSNGVVALHHLECGASLEKKKSINCSMAFFLNFFPIIIPGNIFHMLFPPAKSFISNFGTK